MALFPLEVSSFQRLTAVSARRQTLALREAAGLTIDIDPRGEGVASQRGWDVTPPGQTGTDTASLTGNGAYSKEGLPLRLVAGGRKAP